MATTYVSMSNLTKYDGLLKQYIADGWYNKTETDGFIAVIEDREANFIDKTVNDLVNYYTKSETYNKTEVDAMVSAIPKFAIVVVDELPTEDISTTTVYLVRSGVEEHNLFTEYIYVDDEWEILGTQKIDLSDYYTMEEVDYLLPKNLSELTDDIGNVTDFNIGDVAVTGIRGESELVYQRGDITLNKRMVGLSLVENKNPRQIIAQMTGEDITSALGFMPLDELAYKPNSANDDGYVAKSNGATNKVWGTGSDGVPGWQDSVNPTSTVTGVKGSSEVDYRTGNVIISKDNIGLGNVENKSSATILSELTQSDVLTKIGVLPIANGGTGNANGYIQTGVKEGTSIGSGSTIEGKNNQVTGKQSHAEGYGNRVTSNYAHAEGYVTVASGSTSHAEGTGTTAGYANQHVSGKYNNNKNTTLLEIGNGESSSAKSNAFEVHNDGYISTGEEAKIKFGKNANDEYGYYKYGEDTLTPFGSGGSGGGDVTGVKGDAESSYRTGNVNITPANIGAVATSDKGVANGVAELDNSGKVPSSQLPSYVDDVEEYASLSNFPATGESGKIYVALDTNKTYRWTGSTYVELSEGVVLGETSSTAYRGDRGKIAYDDSQTNKAAIGTLANLETTVKTDLVSAINEVAQGGGGGSSTYAGLTDVSLHNLSNGDIPIYDSEEQKWLNSNALTQLIATVGEVNEAFNSLFNDDYSV